MYHGWKFRQLTMDEVWENQPDLIQWERENNWEQCHGRLYNAVGIREKMQYYVFTDELRPGMVFLVCSDGLYKYCSEQFLKKSLRKVKIWKSLQISADELLNQVYKTDAIDNISLVLVKV